jgi:hypothetical protein
LVHFQAEINEDKAKLFVKSDILTLEVKYILSEDEPAHLDNINRKPIFLWDDWNYHIV